ncbi:MAG: hypothetical protein HWQ41_23385 [Nostoc sp. NOS(2021)]|uniref:hypothetical protein n=1 Tax=Nostoc sp. NOS(2021) TaxID=2815407 RepID=UPI0025D88647|nr:hypothetical protein [Nostoc sp. NOS(2021)]MBN3898105.1 hypothetical protein [Nostoc sp. NOS(2021)]
MHNLFLTLTREINPGLRHRLHRRDVCTLDLSLRHCDFCTSDRDYPTLDHVVSACDRLYF